MTMKEFFFALICFEAFGRCPFAGGWEARGSIGWTRGRQLACFIFPPSASKMRLHSLQKLHQAFWFRTNFCGIQSFRIDKWFRCSLYELWMAILVTLHVISHTFHLFVMLHMYVFEPNWGTIFSSFFLKKWLSWFIEHYRVLTESISNPFETDRGHSYRKPLSTISV